MAGQSEQVENAQNLSDEEDVPASEISEKERFDNARKKRLALPKEVRKAINAQDTNDNDNQINEIHISKDFKNAFTPLLILKDHYRGIKTRFETLESKTPVLIRDAREQTEEYPCEAIFCNYAILGLNYLNGLKDLLEIFSEKNPDSNINLNAAFHDLNLLAQQYYKNIMPPTKNPTKEALRIADLHAEAHFGRFFHTVIVPYYQKYDTDITKEEAIEKITLARDFANMKLAPYAVATVSRTKLIQEFKTHYNDQDYLDHLELEMPLLELTDDQKKRYENRENQDWYKCQSETARALIDKYADRITSGQNMIPAQLIHHLIGMRNGYEKVTTELSSNSLEPNILNTTYHAGSQAHLFERDPKSSITKENAQKARQAATNATIKQVILTTGATKTQHFNTLVSPINRFSKDPEMARQIKTGVKKYNEKKEEDAAKATYNNTPLNIARKVSSTSLAGIMEILQAAETILNGNDEVEAESNVTRQAKIETYLSSTSEHPEKPDPLLLKIYSCAQELKACTDQANLRQLLYPAKLFQFFTPENLNVGINLNLDIAAQANLLVNYLEQFRKNQPNTLEDPEIAIMSGCKSGQDRGGMLNAHTSVETMFNALITKILPLPLNKKSLNKQKQLLQESHARAGATQMQTGSPGAGHGPCDIKEKSILVIPSSYSKKARRAYTGVTGKYNEKKPKNPDKPFYRKKTFWRALFTALEGFALILRGRTAKGIESVLEGGKRMGLIIHNAVIILDDDKKQKYLEMPKNEYEVPEAKHSDTDNTTVDGDSIDDTTRDTSRSRSSSLSVDDDESDDVLFTPPTTPRSRSNSVGSNNGSDSHRDSVSAHALAQECEKRGLFRENMVAATQEKDAVTTTTADTPQSIT